MPTTVTIRVDGGDALPRIVIEPAAWPVTDGPSGSSLCDTATWLSRAVSRWLSRGSSVGLLPGEPTLTDFVLVELAVRHPRQVTVVRSTTWVEAREGTDFEMRLSDGAYALDFRVQAKKMTPASGSYAELAAGAKRAAALAQCVKLTASAAAAVPPAFPVYLFYNALGASPWASSDVDGDARRGCSLSSAAAVALVLAGGGPADPGSIEQVPWETIFCHGDETQPLVGDWLWDVVDDLFRQQAADQDPPSSLVHATDSEADAAWLAASFDDDLGHRVLFRLED